MSTRVTFAVVALFLVACGRIEDESADSRADSETAAVDEVGSSGSNHDATGGHSATGGEPATGAADSGISTGGSVNDLPEPWGPCNFQHPGLDPPCGESDVNGLLSGCGLWFDVPLAHIMPPAHGLQVVLLPLTPDDGVSGVGGTAAAPAEPLPLDLIPLFPDDALRPSGETFDVLEPTGYVRAGDAREDELPGYVEEAESYGVAKVALLQGTEILAVYRGLYMGTTDSVEPSDPCVK